MSNIISLHTHKHTHAVMEQSHNISVKREIPTHSKNKKMRVQCFLSLSLSLSISLSISRYLDLSWPIWGEAETSRGGHGSEGGGTNVDKITLSKQAQSKLGLILF